LTVTAVVAALGQPDIIIPVQVQVAPVYRVKGTTVEIALVERILIMLPVVVVVLGVLAVTP